MRRLSMLALAAVLAGCGGAAADGDCGTLELRRQGGWIEATFAVSDAAAGDSWRVVFVHERHVAWRGTARGSFRLRQRMKDYRGSDDVSVRASGPRVCSASATLR